MQSLKEKLIGRMAADLALREQLQESGELAEGYHPDMEALHAEHARWLGQLFDQLGEWPGFNLAGREGSEAAWVILQHAISFPALMRKGCRLLAQAVQAGEADPIHLAYLQDRIAFFERRPQCYGTQYDWDENGKLKAWEVDDPKKVAQRRKGLNMRPIVEQLQLILAEGLLSPSNPKERLKKWERWLKKTGW